jgi:hypothetical protein
MPMRPVTARHTAGDACAHDLRPLTFETMLMDPLIRLVMDSDGITLGDLLAVLETARAAVVAREARALREAGRGRDTRPPH